MTVVALRLGRSFVGIEISPEFAEMARRRITDDGPLFNVDAEVGASALAGRETSSVELRLFEEEV